ncbi:MAG: hypothetical protein CBC38_04755 [Gammaproteobacteria bacterium TMED78]|nr:MAG: hypothetical protein CBC38_04755 [Gammaproteobacteria bacterium TMED78]|tara:strand:+ start:4951 stop:5418 length:468 start_codon:yes stop_codon:yes gene_type:complete
MAEEEVTEVKEEEEKKKGPLGKLKDAILPDAEEQAAIISTAVRITVLAWSGGILTLNYVSIPGIPQQKIDPTFIASVFTGVLASFGIQTASKKGDGTMKMNGNGNGNGNGGAPPVTAKDIEAIIAKAGPTQTIRIEQAPLKIIGVSDTDEKPYKL